MRTSRRVLAAVLLAGVAIGGGAVAAGAAGNEYTCQDSGGAYWLVRTNPTAWPISIHRSDEQEAAAHGNFVGRCDPDEIFEQILAGPPAQPPVVTPPAEADPVIPPVVTPPADQDPVVTPPPGAQDPVVPPDVDETVVTPPTDPGTESPTTPPATQDPVTPPATETPVVTPPVVEEVVVTPPSTETPVATPPGADEAGATVTVPERVEGGTLVPAGTSDPTARTTTGRTSRTVGSAPGGRKADTRDVLAVTGSGSGAAYAAVLFVCLGGVLTIAARVLGRRDDEHRRR